MGNDFVLGVSDFVALLNQTLEFAYPNVDIVGELSNLRVSKGKWVYFDLKDDHSSVKFFGTIYQMPGPLENGMMVQVKGQPRLHQLYGFSVNVLSIRPVGEGSIKKAADLLMKKLQLEGIFDQSRKRALPYPPQKIGLVTSGQSAAYRDFVKILAARWGGVEIFLADVQVQGEAAVDQVVRAIEHFNVGAGNVDVIVVTRGGGSADDLAVFSTEQVTRAIAISRVPTLVAIGHEVDISLAELAADVRASTPSNAAELLVPDKNVESARIGEKAKLLLDLVVQGQEERIKLHEDSARELNAYILDILDQARDGLSKNGKLLEAFSPMAVLSRGYAIIRAKRGVIRVAASAKPGDEISIQMMDGAIKAEVK